jgi:hypothetical protein
VWGLSELMVEHDSFDHAMRTMAALYSENLAAPTGDSWIDRGVLKPKADAGTTVYGGETGAKYQADADGAVEMSPKDAAHLSLRSWERV